MRILALDFHSVLNRLVPIMAHRFSVSASLLPLSVIVLTLSACQTAPAPQVAPADTVPPIVNDGGYRGLETRVQTLESQMRVAQPTLRKVDAMESHFKALSLELDQISKNYNVDEAPVMAAPVADVVEKQELVPAAAAPVKAPEPKKIEPKKAEPKKEEAKAPVVPSNVFAVTSVRVGEQSKDVTRIVLDTTKAAEIHYDLDNTEGLLVIDIPKAKWSTTESQTFAKSPMVKSFKASSDESGAHFVTDLKQKAKVIATARLAPSGNSGNRVYIDIAPAK